ncbi:MAG: hypothetical protein LQ346_008867 [Caloplaca aetnensis]|nr:MAG: hypothetical protein LQ346_008867 [Caloplaca aetnensis]
MLVGLRVRERVRGYEIEGEREEVEKEEVEREKRGRVSSEEEEEEGGGFLPEAGGEEALPTAGFGMRRSLVDDDSEDSDIYAPSDEDGEHGPRRRKQSLAASRTRHTPMISAVGSQQGGFITEDELAGGFLPEDDDQGGGFMAETDDFEAGGFLPEDSDHDVVEAQPAQRKESHLTASATTPNAENEEQTLPQSPPSTLQKKPQTQQTAIPANYQLIEEEEEQNDSTFVEENLDLHRSMTDAEMEEGRMLAELYERGELGSNHAPFGSSLPQQGSNRKDVDGGETGDAAAKEEGAENIDGANADDRVEDEDPSLGEEEDKGSLLSEDPEDEDAEPDWLL